MGRTILAVIVGVLLAGIVVGIVQSVGHAVYPLPEGLDPENPDDLKAAMLEGKIKTGAMLFVILAWGTGSFCGGLVAQLIAQQKKLIPALVVGGIMLCPGIAMMVMIPSPLWFWIAGIMVFVPSALLGGWLVRALSKPTDKEIPMDE